VKDFVTPLTDYFPYLGPEIVLIAAACLLFLGGTWRSGRNLWGAAALVSLAIAGVLLVLSPVRAFHKPPDQGGVTVAVEQARASLYAAPVVFDQFALLIRALSLLGGAILVLTCWDEVPDEQAADFHACLLLIIAGMNFTGMASELITLFLAMELTSIPTYVILYLPRTDPPAQEAAMKYFFLSIFSSAFLLFGFSYFYGLTGTTNLRALCSALQNGRAAAEPHELPGVALMALVMVLAGLGFRISAVPFHFYAPDVYQGTTTSLAAMLAFVPKLVGFAALIRVLGFVLSEGPNAAGVLVAEVSPSLPLGDQAPFLFWIVAAVTMSLGNLLALLQDNVKRMLAYSSVAHAGYMLMGLAVAPKLTSDSIVPVGGVQAVLFYIVAYSAMTIGAFAILSWLSTRDRSVETVDDLAGLARGHPGVALLMVLFLFSLIGVPLTAGFLGKLWLFVGVLGVRSFPDDIPSLAQQRLFVTLGLIAAINAAIGAWYYLRIATVMYLREPLQPLPKPRPRPVGVAVVLCAVLTLGIGVWPRPLVRAVQAAVSQVPSPGPAEVGKGPDIPEP
jgi:NADH-quinone oxidoreductase subunit N